MTTLCDLPDDIRGRIAAMAIATRMHDVYRAAIYNSTVLQGVRFDRLLRAPYNARHPRVMISKLASPHSLSRVDGRGRASHELAWNYFPEQVCLVPVGFQNMHLPKYKFNVTALGFVVETAVAEGALHSFNVRDERDRLLSGLAEVRAYAQDEYERLLRAVIHYQATEIQRAYRGLLGRRRAAVAWPHASGLLPPKVLPGRE